MGARSCRPFFPSPFCAAEDDAKAPFEADDVETPLEDDACVDTPLEDDACVETPLEDGACVAIPPDGGVSSSSSSSLMSAANLPVVLAFCVAPR